MTKRGSLGAALLASGALTGAALAAYRELLRRPQPRTHGAAPLPGLSAAADLVRDAWGIPHIRAASLADACAVQGFVHAQDRLWSLELNRRAGAGRLAELFGPIALPADRFLRRIGLRRAAEAELAALDAPTLVLLEAYAAGVNAGIAALPALPLEFRLLRHRPEPWRVLDSLAYAKMLAWTLSGNWESELLRTRLLARLGPERAARLEPGYPDDHPLTTPEASATLARDLLVDYERAMPFLAQFSGGASNAWAVSGQRSATGVPLLAADPHLALQMPSVWHEIHLTTPEADMAGADVLGLPGIVIGHNGHIAWGLTAAPVDVEDLYIERLDPADPTRYEVNGQWQRARVIGEVIAVRGQAQPVIEEVRVTRHGPIVTPLKTSQAALALRWVCHEPDRLTTVLLAVPLARDWAAARQTLAGLVGPPINVVAADRGGTIAYQLAGAVPTRPGGGGLLPVPGWTDHHEWGAPIPFDELPHVVNPPGGVVITANHQPSGGDRHYLGHDWSNGYRARRIADLLADRERHTVADFARMQQDVLSLPGLRLMGRLADLDPAWLSPVAAQAHDLIRAWDGEMRAESAGAAVYGRLMPTLQRRLYGEALGEVLDEFLGLGQHDIGNINIFWGRTTPLTLALLDEADLGGLTPRIDHHPAGASRPQALLVAALEETAADLSRLLGPNPAAWRWGALNRVTWRHPLSAVKGLAPLLNRGPFELPGDLDTVNYAATLPYPVDGTATQAWLPAYRLVVDLADPTRSIALMAGGEWGQPGSSHYADQIGAWRSGRYHALLYDWSAIEKAAIHRLVLLPALGPV
ncbi:MAG: penicillin acylase family protein [Chloroflexi bacterium]|nr:penicillin acylase family protein [Chloroflexota bacterium]